MKELLNIDLLRYKKQRKLFFIIQDKYLEQSSKYLLIASLVDLLRETKRQSRFVG
jgi:hypothetical protein